MTESKKTSQKQGGLKGALSFDRSEARKFPHFEVAERSEKLELIAERKNDERYKKAEKMRRQEAIMNIHSRLGGSDLSRSPSKRKPIKAMVAMDYSFQSP